MGRGGGKFERRKRKNQYPEIDVEPSFPSQISNVHIKRVGLCTFPKSIHFLPPLIFCYLFTSFFVASTSQCGCLRQGSHLSSIVGAFVVFYKENVVHRKRVAVGESEGVFTALSEGSAAGESEGEFAAVSLP